MIVTACEQCPCSERDPEPASCEHPAFAGENTCRLLECVPGHFDADGKPVWATYPIPSWCPLRVAPLTIEVG